MLTGSAKLISPLLLLNATFTLHKYSASASIFGHDMLDVMYHQTLQVLYDLYEVTRVFGNI